MRATPGCQGAPSHSLTSLRTCVAIAALDCFGDPFYFLVKTLTRGDMDETYPEVFAGMAPGDFERTQNMPLFNRIKYQFRRAMPV